MKNIILTGSKNKKIIKNEEYKKSISDISNNSEIKNIEKQKNTCVRSLLQDNNLIENNIEELGYKKEINLINNMYLDISNDFHNENLFIIKELEKKINSYKSQDKKKSIYDENKLITFNELIEKLVISKLKCKYCMNIVKLFYKYTRDMSQWTLDRIDNNLCHSNENTIICCLDCNLKRRNINSDKFNFTKKLKLNKTE